MWRNAQAYRQGCEVSNRRAQVSTTTIARSAEHHRVICMHVLFHADREIRECSNLMTLKRTTLNLDIDLIEAARRVFGTKGTTDTIHRALEDAVRRQRLEELLAQDLPSITPQDLEKIRRDRVSSSEKLQPA